MNRGIVYGLAAYGLWGVLPIYWKLLEQLPALEILAHRTAWSFLFLLVVLAVQRRWSWLRAALNNWRTCAVYLTAATLLAVNWGTFIWAVNAGYVIETSLGYFINPLVNVLLGFLFLGERLRPRQGVAIALAAGGVLYLTWQYGAPPWIALVLAFTFGFYGLLKKKAPLNALEGLSLETALLFWPAVAFLLYLEWQGVGTLGHVGLSTTLLLALTGVATAVPLLLFAAAAQRVTLTALGLMQYLGPTIQFLLGVFLFREPFAASQLIGFGLIWVALVVYTAGGLYAQRHPR